VEIAKWLRNFKYSGQVTAAGASAFAYSMEALRFVTYALSAIFLGLYIMLDRDRLRGGLFAVVPRSHHIRLSRVLMNLETIVGAYIRGQVITSAAIGLFILVLLVSCGVENAMALAIFGSIADILPYIGIFLPIAAAVLSAASHGPAVTVVVLALMLLYMEFESRVLVPRVYGQALRLPSTVVLFSLLVGGTLMGIPGFLLSLPFAAAVMMLIEELRVHLPGVQEQMADGVLREKDDRGEEEYERRTEGVSTEKSAAIAVEISGDRVKEENQVLEVEE
jgi:predicted PurR-regulated permease PerM